MTHLKYSAPVLSSLLTLVIPFWAQAANTPLAANCRQVYSAPAKSYYSRGENDSVQDWKSDSGFRSLLSKSEKMGAVRGQFDKKLDTRIYYTATGLPDKFGKIPMIDPEASAVVVFFHGSGTMQSGGVNFVHNMNKLANIGVSAMSFDMPFHGEGPIRDQFYKTDYFMNWVRQVIQPALQSGKPVYLVGHSFGPDVIAEYLYRFPNDVQGAALLSPASFNKTLEEWYQKKTSKMKFGDVAGNTMAGQWAYRVAQGFTWSKSQGSGDPTIANQNLKVEILVGDREEYVPAPVGGPKKTPIGKNTYDMEKALRPFFKNAHITIEPGIGHYLFNHSDASGKNVVSRTIYDLIGFDYGQEKAKASEIAASKSARPYWVQLNYKMRSDDVFMAYLKSQNQVQLAENLVAAGNNEQAKKMLELFTVEFKERAAGIKIAN
jgi:pimeloyl-ACP methyl ester carboxylesterase